MTFVSDYSTVCFIDSYQPAYVLAADKVLTDLAKRFVQNLPPVREIEETKKDELFSDVMRSNVEHSRVIKRLCSNIIE